MTGYITSDDLRDYIGSDTANFATVADSVCTVASRMVDNLCDRTFSADTNASIRTFPITTRFLVEVDDFYTTDSLIVKLDDAGNGTYTTTLTIGTDFSVQPANQQVGGINGYPYTHIRAGYTRPLFPYPLAVVDYVQVTAKWGWETVPDPVVQSTLVLASQLFKGKDADGAGYVGLDGWGPVPVKESKWVRSLLGPYMRAPIASA